MSQITPDILLRAYAFGVFPMAESRHEDELFWVDPEKRGVLPLDGFHVPRRLRKTIRREPFEVRTNTAFSETIAGCAAAVPGRRSTWINTTIQDLYIALHRRGYAHSVECWADGALVGGLYGVSLGAAFFGESMFSRATDASKIALVYLVARLRYGGYRLLDTQFITSHLEQFGVVEIPRDIYRDLLGEAVGSPADFHAMPSELAPQDVLQLSSQMS